MSLAHRSVYALLVCGILGTAGMAQTPPAKTNPEAARWQAMLAEADEEVKKQPKEPFVWIKRGAALDRLFRYKDAEASYTRALEIARAPEALDRRGSSRFFQGDLKGSLADFDAFLSLKPQEKPGHWRRGIALYYAGDFAEGARQFEGYQTVDSNDVENAVWHFLCNAAQDGTESARKKILPIGRDRRAPLMEVYSLFKGELAEEAVLASVEKIPAGPARDSAYFYGHLYLALWKETKRDKQATLTHLKEAVGPYRNFEYMGEVARVHKEWIEAGQWPKLPDLKK